MTVLMNYKKIEQSHLNQIIKNMEQLGYTGKDYHTAKQPFPQDKKLSGIQKESFSYSVNGRGELIDETVSQMTIHSAAQGKVLIYNKECFEIISRNGKGIEAQRIVELYPKRFTCKVVFRYLY